MGQLVPPEVSQSRLNFNFLAKFNEERARTLAFASDFYQRLSQRHEHVRSEFEAKYAPKMDDLLPDSTCDFYNRVFGEVSALVEPLLPSLELPDARKHRAREIYSYRLRSKATLRDLLAADIFARLTIPLDIPIEPALAGSSLDAIYECNDNTRHLFLHRAQETEFLFLHELMVGYLVNLHRHGGKTYGNRVELPLLPDDYYVSSAYTFEVLARIVGVPARQLVGLHFAESAHVRATVPQSILDTMTLASHTYWYLECINHDDRYGSVGVALTFLQSFLVIPTLERIERQPSLRLRPNAADDIDRALGPGARGDAVLNPVDLAHALLTISDTVWVP